jgi:hypothetical protein
MLGQRRLADDPPQSNTLRASIGGRRKERSALHLFMRGSASRQQTFLQRIKHSRVKFRLFKGRDIGIREEP